jgi:guanylate kinase
VIGELKRQGILCVVSGPSGSGKTTLCRGFSEYDSDCAYAVSCTTRPPREGEVDGRDYHFLSEEEFLARTTRGELLEFARVHGRLYGTLKSSVLEHLDAGRDVLMDIDVQGAELVRKHADETIVGSLVDVFILLGSREEALARLRGRATEGEEELELRLNNSLEEMRHWRDYHYAIISGTPQEDREKFRSIINAERCRASRLLSVDDDAAESALH